MVVPGYVDLREVGRGGFAVVYSARSEDSGELVALKVFPSSDVDRRRISREIGALERLAGIPGVVPVLGITEADDGSPVMVMPFLPSTMAERIRDGGVPPEVAVGWLADIGTAIDQAALLGVHHRDVKPGNVLLDDDGRALLADFGISAVAEVDTGTTTASAFSPPYAAPERMSGRDGTDPTAGDVYSLAATTWAAIVGDAPFGSVTTGGVSGLVTRVMANELDRPTTMSSALYDVLRTAMAFEPADRYPTASALVAAARDAIAHPDDVTVARPIDALITAGPAPISPAAAPLMGAPLAADSEENGSDDIDDDGYEQTDPDPDSLGPDDRSTATSNARKVTLVAAALLLLVLLAGSFAVMARPGDDVRTVDKASTRRPDRPTGPRPDPTATVDGTTLDAPPDTVPAGGAPTDVALAPTDTVIGPGSQPATAGAPVAAPAPTPAPAPAPATRVVAPTPTPSPAPPTTVAAVPTSCRINGGVADLSPGIAAWQTEAQNATMTTPLSCAMSSGGTMNATMLLRAHFPSLSFTGGSTSGSGSISWTDGRSTQVNARIEVLPTDDISRFDVVLTLTFSGGVGAPGYGTTEKLRVISEFDPVAKRVVQIRDMNGSFPWIR